MTLEAQVKSDLATAMKAGEKDRVGALRLVLSELQKAAKDGSGDEQAVLRRERKRRRDAEVAFRDAGRGELAAQEDVALEVLLERPEHRVVGPGQARRNGVGDLDPATHRAAP